MNIQAMELFTVIKTLTDISMNQEVYMLSKQKREIKFILDEFSDWLKRDGQPMTQKQIQELRNRKKKTRVCNAQDDICKKAFNINKIITKFARQIQNSEDQKILINFHKRMIFLYRKINLVLDNPQELSKQAKVNLYNLQETLDEQISYLSKMYQNLFPKQAQTNSTKIGINKNSQLRKNGNFDIKHQQRRSRTKRIELANVGKK